MKQYKCVILPSVTVVKDEKDKNVVSCPTEDEAIEYIRGLEEDKKEQEGSQ